MDKPSVFIGSSTEGLDFARAVRDKLDIDAETTLWDEGIFTLSNTFIESLVNSVARFDFAVLVLTPDDLVSSRNDESLGPRDNVIFELGLFMGGLGRSRTFIVHQAESKLKMPTDLLGVSTATYRWPRSDNNHLAAVGPACDAIRRVIRDLGITESKAAKQLQEVRQGQDRLQNRIDQVQEKINNIVTYTLSFYLFEHIRKLYKEQEYRYHKNPNFERDLRLLRDLGYLEYFSVGALNDGENLVGKVKLTPLGKLLVELREERERVNDPTPEGGA